ncbi:hypothetical protein ACNQUF_12250, partial [Corynebacterium diphtheriae]
NLLDLDIETLGKEQRKGNIYKGIITRIEPSLEAAYRSDAADRPPHRSLLPSLSDPSAHGSSERASLRILTQKLITGFIRRHRKTQPYGMPNQTGAPECRPSTR